MAVAARNLWSRAFRARDVVKAKANRSAKARLVLAGLLAQAGYDVGLVVVHSWTREQQGNAYLWARAFVDGREDLSPPRFVVQACEAEPCAKRCCAGARR